MARLPAGQKPEPLNQRLLRYRHDLEERGGKRVIVDLEPEAHDALKTVIAGEGLEEERDKFKRAVSTALLHYAKVVRRRAG